MRFPSLLIAGALLTAPATAGPIKHVVLLMFENHSFDNMLGWLTRNNSQVKGLVGNESNPLDPQNPSSPRVVVTDRGAYSDPDPDHSVPATTLQIYGTQLNADVEHNPADILMDGFVAAYAKHGSNGSIIMDCFKPEAVPVISTLAMEFALFDEYFAGVPGPTFPNRLFGMSATSDGYGDNNDTRTIIGWPQASIFERLDQVNSSWRVYFEDAATPWLLQYMRTEKNLAQHHRFSKFYEDAAKGDLAAFTWLDPAYFTVPDVQNASDQHPAHDVVFGEALLKRVYDALRSSPAWNETALIVTYDEHGGFFDHMPTPVTDVPSPDGKPCIAGCDPSSLEFTRLGVRVPFIVASPWVPKGLVVHANANATTGGGYYEHSSIAASMHNMFDTASFLNARDAAAAPFDWIFNLLPSPRTDCPMVMPDPPVGSPAFDTLLQHGTHGAGPVNHLQADLLRMMQGVAGTAATVADADAATTRLNVATEADAGRYSRRLARDILSSVVKNPFDL